MEKSDANAPSPGGPETLHAQSRPDPSPVDPRPLPRPDRLTIKGEGRIILLQIDEIDWAGAADNYVEIHSRGTVHMLLSTLTAFEKKLPVERFQRISRSTVVNLDRIKEVRFRRHGDGVVILADGTHLTFSRSHRRRLVQLLEPR